QSAYRTEEWNAVPWQERGEFLLQSPLFHSSRTRSYLTKLVHHPISSACVSQEGPSNESKVKLKFQILDFRLQIPPVIVAEREEEFGPHLSHILPHHAVTTRSIRSQST